MILTAMGLTWQTEILCNQGNRGGTEMRGAGPEEGLARNSPPHPKALPLTQALMAQRARPDPGGAVRVSPPVAAPVL